MAKLTDKHWEQIEVRYKAGDKLRDIATDYNYDSGNIAKKAKKEGWLHGELHSIPNFDLDEHFASIKEKAEDTQDVKALRLILAIKEQEAIKEQYKYNSIQALINAKPFQVERIDRQLNNGKGLREKSALDTIEQLLGIKLIRQFQVGGFRIDGYDADNKVAYEIDEEQHNTKKHSQADILRQQFIETQLGCTFKRIKV